MEKPAFATSTNRENAKHIGFANEQLLVVPDESPEIHRIYGWIQPT